MIAIDTNVLLRYIVKDDEEQALVAAKFIQQN
jgi:predicted nucleic-acid-binding protein